MADTTDSKKLNPVPNSTDTGDKREQRKHKRVDFFNPVKVVVPSDNTSIDVFAANVSKGGMFIRSNQPLSPGKKMRLTFSTQKGPVQVDEAEVRWAKRFEPISVDGSPPGMGVEFRNIGNDSLENIGAFIDDILGQDSPEASIPKPPEPQTQPALPVASPMDSKEESPVNNSELEHISSTTAPAQTPPRVQDHGSEEDMAAAFSTPPPTRARMLLFVGFVLIVAVLTFLTLMWIKPFGHGAQKTTLNPVRQGKHNKPVDGSKLGPKKTIHDQEQLADKKEKVGEKTKNNISPQASKPQASKPAIPKTKPAEEAKHQSRDIATPANDSNDATSSTNKKKAGDTSKSADSTSDTSSKIFSPQFSKTEEGWKMTISADVPISSKYFSLKSPSRLAIDIKGAKWPGQAQIENPAPFVSKIRIGKQPDFVRIVLDFKTEQVPRYKVEKAQKSLTVQFPGIK